MKILIKSIGLSWLLACVFTTAGYAQLVTGNIVGTVKDSSGAFVPGATITVTNIDKNAVLRIVKTDAHGEYSAKLLPSGKYAVKADAANFKATSETGITIDVNQSATIDLVLQVGSESQSITVEAASLQVNLQDAQAQTVITGQQITELAINTRNYEQLVGLMPGVSQDTSDQLYLGVSNPVGTSNQINFAINGGRPTQNSWLLDGADNVDRGANLTLLAYPSVDSMAEFSVQRGQFGAEYGRSSAGVINVITKSGTDKFHGDLYEFFRNDIFQANNYLLNRANVARPSLRYNDFGGTIGGPIIHDHLFFFFSEEVRRVLTHTAFLATVPTLAERAGNFTIPVCLDAACSAMGTQVTHIDPVAQAYIKDIFAKLPPPDDPNCTMACTIATPGRNIFNARQEIVRIDQVFSPRFTLFGRYENDTIPTQEPGGLFTGSGLPGVSNTTTNSPGRIVIIHATNTFFANLLNDGGFSYSHGGVISDPIGLESTRNSPNIGNATKLPFTSTIARVPDLNFNNFDSIGGFGPYRDFNDNYSGFDNVSKVLGRHTVQVGAVYNHYTKDENAGRGNNGSFNGFNCTVTACVDGEYQEFANFLEGNVNNFSQTSQDFRAVIHQQEFEFYAQDQFRFRPNLTVNYGLRYSLFRQPTDANGHLTTFDPARYVAANAPQLDSSGNLIPGTGDPLNGIIIGGKNSPFGDAIARQNNKNFAPRVGVAWDPYGKGLTSVRAGYGIFYDSPSVNPYETAVFNNPPFVDSANIFNTTLDAPGGVAAAPNLGVPVISGTSTSYKQPYVQEWSLDVQQQLWPSVLLDIGYYGSKGTHLLGDLDINEPPVGAYVTALGLTPPITFGTTQLLNLIRPFRGYDAMNIESTIFISSYHSLQVAAQKRFGNNSQLSANYTWSKSLTDANGDFSTPLVTSQPKLDYGPAQFDRRNIFNANYVYNLPFYQHQAGLVGHVLGGWEVSGIVIAQSGLPFTATEFINDPAGTGSLGNSPSSPRPDQIGNPNSGDAPHTFLKWFNTAAFAQVPNGQVRIGSARHGSIIGPGTERWDVSLDKNTRITEGIKLQFRADATNVLNHTNFNHISTNSTSSRFGRVASVGDPRVIQLALKLYF
ncbi:MAG: carboxypeptidase regulatory-like domain-containing protein [Acidobacteriaceae bacterium]